MNGTLVRKEARDLLPWGVLVAVLAIAEIAAMLLVPIDMLPLGRTFPDLNGLSAVFYWVVAFAIGTGLAVREHDDRTAQFLDGLPVSRTRVFLVKCVVMYALVLLVPIVRVAAVVGLHALSRGSLDAEWRVVLLAQASGLQSLLLLNGLMLGAAFGRLRSLTWLMAGVTFAVLLLLAERVPSTAVWNPLSLLRWQVSAAGLRVDGNAVALHAGVALAAFLVAWHGFVRGGQPQRAAVADRPFVSAAVTFSTVAVAIILMALIAPQRDSAGDEPTRGATASFRFSDGPPARTSTRHYRFSYPTSQSEAAFALAEQADEIFERVHAMLGLPLGAPIDVDVSGTQRNTHGTAFFERIRMTLDSDVALVLAHETVHVIAQRTTGQVRNELWNAAPLLNEGLASWVDADFRAPSSLRDERLRVLAALHARRALLIDELVTPSAFERQLDEGLKYSAGDAMIRALVRVYGVEAPRRLLEAFGEAGLPADVRGMRLWHAVFQAADMDASAVIDDFYREISEYAAAHADWLAGLPHPRVLLIRRGGRFGARVLVDPPQWNGPLVVRFRPATSRALATISTFDVHPGAEFGLDSQSVSGGRVCVQPGVRIGAEVLFERWQCIPVAEAVEQDDKLPAQ